MTDTTALPAHELPGHGARCAVHPERAARVTCTRCGNFACEECETRGDSGAVVCRACESAGDGGVIPWEKRAELGIPRAFLQTTLAVLLRPWEFFLLRPREPSILPVVIFAWIVYVPASLLGILTNLLSLDSQRAQLLANPITRDWVWVAEPPFALGVGLGTLLFWPVTLLLNAVIWQLSLMPFAAAKRPFKETMRALAYTNVTSLPLLALLPVVGILNVLGLQTIGGIVFFPFFFYTYAMHGIAMWKIHRVDGWRVFAAVGAQLATFVLLSCLLAAILVGIIVAFMPLPLR